MEEKIMIGIIIMCFLVLFGLVIYLNVKLLNKEADMRSKFKNARWIIMNQMQQNIKAVNPNSGQITQEQSNCSLDGIISKYGLNDTVIGYGFGEMCKFVIESTRIQNMTPLKATTDFLNSADVILSESTCEHAKKCGIPSNIFNTAGSTGVTCNY